MRSDAARPAGFTLVELMMVLALVGLCAALAAPALSGTFARARLDGAAAEVQTAWSAARLEAIRSGRSVAFQCRLGTGEYTVSALDDAAAALAGSAEAADQRAVADDSHADDLGAVRFTQLTLGDPATDPTIDPAVAACVVFRPDGAADDAIAVLTADDGRARRVLLRGLTGAATVEFGTASPAE